MRFPTFACLHPPGNSHSRGPCPLLAIPDLRLPASATGGGRLRSHRRRADGNLVKYGVRTHLEMIREENSLALHKRKHPTFVGCFLLWNPATSYSPGRFHPRCFAHRARVDGNLSKYNVRIHLMTGREKQFPEGKEISPATRLSLFLWNPATSYSPGQSPGKYHRR